MWVNFHFMLVYSPACSTCLFSWYGLLITVGGVGGESDPKYAMFPAYSVKAKAPGIQGIYRMTRAK